MDINKILESIRNFLEVDGWTYFHLKADGPTGQRREMFITNVPLVTEEPQQAIIEGEIQPEEEIRPTEESTQDRVARIRLTPIDQIAGTDLEWWKALQMQLSQNGTRPQIEVTDSPEDALRKLTEAGIIG